MNHTIFRVCIGETKNPYICCRFFPQVAIVNNERYSQLICVNNYSAFLLSLKIALST